MSLDLVVLTRGSSPTYADALEVWSGRRAGVADESRVRAFAVELERVFSGGTWPFAGDPIVLATHAEIVVAPEAWEEVTPAIVAIAHRHDLVALDPQWERLFPPGVEYDAAREDQSPVVVSRPVQVRIHHGDGTIEEREIGPEASPSGTNRLRRLWVRLRRGPR